MTKPTEEQVERIKKYLFSGLEWAGGHRIYSEDKISKKVLSLLLTLAEALEERKGGCNCMLCSWHREKSIAALKLYRETVE